MEPTEHRQPPQPPQPPKRRKSLLLPILLVGVFVLLMVFFLGISFLVLSFRTGPEPVSVSRGSVLSLPLSGVVEEYRPPSPLESFFAVPSMQLHDYLSVIQEAADDSRIEGIYLQVGFSNLNWAQVQDLRQAISNFRKKGKWVIAYGEIWTEMEYFLASAADELYMSDESVLWLDGLSSSTMFYGELLEEYGIGVHVEARGKYKTYGDAYRYEAMTDAQREATSAMLASVMTTFTTQVAVDRGLDSATLTTALRDSVYSLDQALDLGLITDKWYPDQIKSHMAQRLELDDVDDLRLIPALNYHRNHPQSGGGSKIAVLYAIGAIQSGSSSVGLFGNQSVGADQFIEDLRAARDDSSVKAIVIRIDSPGGTALASDLIWREIRLAAESGKPIIASMGNVAASGGYYIAMACDEIYARDTTITGSIGVVSMRFHLQDFYEKILVNMDTVKTHPSADFFDMTRPLNDAERQSWQARTNASYRSFVSKVATSRDMSFEKVDAAAQGRVWSGADAQGLGLVDQLGGLQDAIAAAAVKAQLNRYRVVRYPRENNDWDKLFGGFGAQSQLADTAQTVLPGELQFLLDFAAAQIAAQGGQSAALQMQPLALLPHSLKIR